MFRINCLRTAFILIAGLTLGCSGSDSDTTGETFEVVMRLPNEPDNLNPTRSSSSHATPIEGLIMYPLAEYDPYTFELTPLLVKSLARVEMIESGPFAGGERYHYEIREEAKWADGSSVTGHDYLFTLKAVMNPLVNASSWRGYLSFIKDVEIDEEDPRKFVVTVPEPYMLAEVVTCNFNVFPKYAYDPDGLMDDIALSALHDAQIADSLSRSDSSLQAFADAFGSVRFSRDVVQGAGPYRLAEWETGQQIVLERKEDWWGDEVEDAPVLLHAFPDRIVYRIIPDEAVALNALKEGTVDFMSEVSALNFVEMRDDPQWQDQFRFLTPSLMQYHYLELNNRHPVLSEKAVREALAHSIDYDAIIETLTFGMAQRTIGPFHPSKSYYNVSLEPIEQDYEEARKILSDAGWTDTDQDGTVDKVINGERTELELDVTVSQRQEGQQLALLIKESAARVGIGLDIVTRDGNSLLQELRQRSFEILPLRNRTSPSINDPYQLWHSESDQPGGSNRSGFRNARADELIEQIRVAETDALRNELFMSLQELIHEELPVIFLYVPLERIIVNDRIMVEPSSRRPGYFENLFRLSDT